MYIKKAVPVGTAFFVSYRNALKRALVLFGSWYISFPSQERKKSGLEEISEIRESMCREQE
ncbi:hypothetical protein [Prolixibacter denitrificans]|uniref:hypothetical protein n=1 Tax=Prolixibacter denitrificans TaxID=1541063 RepID=UPI000D0E0233|nr:hypothetical protein [Prolixibacter denitrificans]